MIKADLLFILVATISISLFAWLVQTDILVLQPELSAQPQVGHPLSLWHRLVIVVGLILPVGAFLVWRHSLQLQRIFGLYVLVLLAQIATEILLMVSNLSKINFVVGTIYSLWRLGRLGQSLQLVSRNSLLHPRQQKLVQLLLGLLSVTWSVNLVRLVVWRWMAVFPILVQIAFYKQPFMHA